MNRRLFASMLLIFLLACFQGKGQIKQAYHYYDSHQYERAAKHFSKYFTKRESRGDLSALLHMARTQAKLGLNKQAESYFHKVDQHANATPEMRLEYIQILVENEKNDQALAQIEKLSGQYPSNAIISQYQSLLHSSFSYRYKVRSMRELNSTASDFGAVNYKSNIVFVSDRKTDWVSEGEDAWLQNTYLSLYQSSADSKSEKPKLFSQAFSSAFDNGPISFSSSGNLAALTRVQTIRRIKSTVQTTPQLFFLQKTGEKWDKPMPFQHNNLAYSVMHASLSQFGDTLFFVSDLPGGFGGMDIYWCFKKDSIWTYPENLGPNVNTAADESFPHFSSSGQLYFSSTGWPGYGGMDIFWTQWEKDRWSAAENMGPGLNSFSDDFGVFFIDDQSGYFSSNRSQSMGKDDIFEFEAIQLVHVVGRLDVEDTAHTGSVLQVFDERNQKVTEAQVEPDGQFEFKQLDAGKTYWAKWVEEDGSTSLSKLIIASGVSQTPGDTALSPSAGKYEFTALSSVATDASRETSALNGVFYYSKLHPGEKVVLILMDDQDRPLDSVVTNSFGAFSFNNLPPSSSLFLKLGNEDIALSNQAHIQILDANEALIKELAPDQDERFAYRPLEDSLTRFIEPILEKDYSLLRINLSGQIYQKLPGDLDEPKMLYIVNEENEVLYATESDVKGNFVFNKLLPQESYSFRMFEEEDFQIMLKEEGTERAASDEGGGTYRYRRLIQEKSILRLINEDDMPIEIDIDDYFAIPNIYYDYDKYEVNALAKSSLGRLLVVLKKNPHVNAHIHSHTDAIGSEEYNMTLSQKRASAVVDYLVSQGITRNRLNGTGFGETNLVNDCVNKEDCPAQQHAVNRRTEFKLFQ